MGALQQKLDRQDLEMSQLMYQWKQCQQSEKQYKTKLKGINWLLLILLCFIIGAVIYTFVCYYYSDLILLLLF